MIEPHPLIQIINLIDGLHQKTGAIINGFGHDPKSDSIAANELTSLGSPEPLKNAYSQGSLLIEVGADHLSAFLRAVTQPVLTVSAWTSIRGVLEVAAISTWLLDDHLAVKERVARSYAYRCDGLMEQVKFIRSDNPTDSVKAQKRLEDVLDQAKTIGVQTREDKSGRIVGLSQPMPPVTELVRDQLNAESLFRLLSAIVHAHPWALQQLSFRRIDDRQQILLEKNLDIEMILILATTGLRAFRKPIECKCHLFGWPTLELGTIFDQSIEGLGQISKKISSTKT